MKVSIFIAISLDGFIAREDGALDWLPQPDSQTDSPDEDYGYQRFIASVDTLVMGRHTYEKVLSFGEWPYAKLPVVVLANRPVPFPTSVDASVSTLAGTPVSVVATLKAQGATHLYIDGGQTIQRFLEANLVDELIITTVPILIGSGIPLFGRLDTDVQLTHVITNSFPSGLVQTHYVVRRE